MKRLVKLAGEIAPWVKADVGNAQRAALLAKADLTTGMVAEFPELQGVMGGYYARQEFRRICRARDRGGRGAWTIICQRARSTRFPSEPVGITVALADKLDQLIQFFAAGEQPTGSGDPFALRRAALGVIRIIRENRIRLPLRETGMGVDVLAFITERLRIALRTEGARHDLLDAVFAANPDDDLVRLLARTAAVASFLAGPDGGTLLALYKRASNILRIEDKKDGPHGGLDDVSLLTAVEEVSLHEAIAMAEPSIDLLLGSEQFGFAMGTIATLRPPLDAFFEHVTVNDPDPALRRNRLRLLHRLRATMDRVADFSRIEG